MLKLLKDDNRRLSISVGNSSFSVVDTLSGEQFVFDGKNVPDNSLDVEVIKSHISTLQSILMNARHNLSAVTILGKLQMIK